jgi:GTPase SAR1 family protein
MSDLLHSSITDTIRVMLLHSVTAGNSNNGGIPSIWIIGLAMVALSLAKHLREHLHETSFGIYGLYNNIKSVFICKYSVTLKGDTLVTHSMYDPRPRITPIYTDSFKAIWQDIINNITTNDTIKSIREIKHSSNTQVDEKRNRDSTDGMYVVSQKTQFLLDAELEIYAFATDNTSNSDESRVTIHTSTYEITLFSYKSKVSIIDNYIAERTKTYLSAISESRINKQFMYTLIQNKYVEPSERLQCWREDVFQSSKTFNNVFFDNKAEVLDKINFFINNRAWYDTHGIPYTLGIGLYGPPGTGKTSFIKALTNYMKTRHLVNMPMTLIQNKTQLNDFYFETRYNQFNAPNSVDFQNKIIVIEDIDCAGDIVLERSRMSDMNTAKKIAHDTPDMIIDDITLDARVSQMDEEIKTAIRENIMAESRKIMKNLTTPPIDSISLDDILNLWDGLRETTGRILIISSNHYDKLDKAIKRPGRIDIRLELKNASHNIIREMYMHFYGKPIDEERLLDITPELYSPAEIANLYSFYRNDSDAFMNRLCENRVINE